MPAPVQLSTAPDEPLHDAAKRHTPSTSHTPRFDLNLARISLVISIIAYLIEGMAPSGLLFACGIGLQSLGAGYSPSIQAFALEVYHRKGGKGEAGKLFGAFSVVQALG